MVKIPSEFRKFPQKSHGFFPPTKAPTDGKIPTKRQHCPKSLNQWIKKTGAVLSDKSDNNGLMCIVKVSSIFICPSFRRTYYAVRYSGNFFIESSSIFFYICFGPLGIRIGNKKCWCLSFCLSVNTLQATVLVLFVWNLARMCILGTSRNGNKRFLKFQFLPPPGGTLVFFRYTKISKFPQFWSNLHEIWHKSVSMGY